MSTITVTRPGTETQTTDLPNLELLQSKYNFKYLSFPNDLGTDQSGHYMVININVQNNIGTIPFFGTNILPSNFNYQNLLQERSKVDQLRGINSVLRNQNIPGVTQSDTSTTNYLTLTRSTRRIAESIALHMPTPLVFSQQNEYQEVSLTALGSTIINQVAPRAIAAISGLGSGKGGGAIAGHGAASIINGVGGFIGNTAKIMQRPINPAVEVLFANTSLRSFTFEVLMAPRNEKESESIKNIITSLKFHSAPELTFGGLIWIPPAEFDITFFNKGVENPHIQRISTCALERFEVDYAPSGMYSTFRNGHPVAVRMSMGFRELEAIHKQRVVAGF